MNRHSHHYFVCALKCEQTYQHGTGQTHNHMPHFLLIHLFTFWSAPKIATVASNHSSEVPFGGTVRMSITRKRGSLYSVVCTGFVDTVAVV